MFSCSLCPLSIRYIPYVVFIGYGSSSHGLAEILIQGRNSGSNSLTNSSHGIAGLNISSDGELVTDSNSVVGIGLSSELGQGHRSGGINGGLSGGISGGGGRRRASVDSPYTSHNTSYNTSQKTGSSPSSMGVVMDQSSPLHAVGSPVITTNTSSATTIPPLTSSMATNAVTSATTNSTTDTTTTTTTPILPIIPSSPTIRRNSLSSNDLMADLVPINNINDQQVTPLVYPSCIYYPSLSYLLVHIL